MYRIGFFGFNVSDAMEEFITFCKHFIFSSQTGLPLFKKREFIERPTIPLCA